MFWTYVKWLMVLLVWVTLTYGIVQEDRHLRRHVRTDSPPSYLPPLLRMLHLRNIQVWGLLSLLLLITAASDIHTNHDLLYPPAETVTVDTPSAPAPVAAPVMTSPPPPAYDKAFEKPTASSLPFSDITEFNEKDSKQQAYLDWLKQHYEAWFVTYYYLQRCGKTGTNDIVTIDGALQKELAKTHADATVRSNILLAATGSYNELYRDIPCDEAHLSATKASYDANMQHIKGVPQPSAKPANR